MDGRDPRVPEWARLMNAPQFGRFVDAIEAALRAHTWTGDVRAGAIEVRMPDGTTQTLGLQNALQVCHAAPPDDWPALVADHMSRLVGARRMEDLAIEARLVADHERAREALRVRLWPTDFRDQIGAGELVWREDLPGVVTALVLDLPWSVRGLKPAEVAAWGRPVDALFDEALDNVRRRCPPDVDRTEDGVSVVFLSSPQNDHFAASHALLLDGHADCVGPHGAIVGVPHRHLAIAHGIVDLRVVDAINAMLPFTRRCFDEGPGSIDPDLFWYRGRGAGFVRLTCGTGPDGQLRFEPPLEFSEMVGRLREER